MGGQFAGRVGFFLRVDNFEVAHERMVAAGVTFVTAPHAEPYGQVAVFLDLEGNRWDLLGRRETRLLVLDPSTPRYAASISLKSRPLLGAVQDANDEHYVALHRVDDQIRQR